MEAREADEEQAEEAGTRRRVLRAAEKLLQRQGYHATGLRQILAESRAPRGSLYFHFPAGKEQLASEAVRSAGERVARAIAATLAAHPEPAEGVRAFVRAFAEILRRSRYTDGCPVATVTLEASAGSEPIREACQASLGRWQRLVRDHLVAAGYDPGRAEGLATLVLAAVEGGLVLSRARRDLAPLERVADELAALLSSTGAREAAV